MNKRNNIFGIVNFRVLPRLSRATRIMITSKRWNIYEVKIEEQRPTREIRKIKYCIPTGSDFYFYDKSGRYIQKSEQKPNYIKIVKKIDL